MVTRGGVLSLAGEELRLIHGSERIGSDIRRQIRKELDARDIAIDHPEVFYSESLVRLYKRGTAAAQIIEAVNNMGQERDETIRRWISSPGGKLERIRGILDEEAEEE